jgi:hypothetical protein
MVPENDRICIWLLGMRGNATADRPCDVRAIHPERSDSKIQTIMRTGRIALTPQSVPVVPMAVAAVCLLLTAPCLVLECPAPRPAGAPDAIQETPAQINELSRVLASGDLSNQIPVFVHGLRNRHPDLPAGELVNYLVTAYCPAVNKLSGLSNEEKQARLSAFVSQVVKAAY